MEEVTQTMYGLSIQLVLVSPEHAKLKTLQQGCTTQAIAALDPIASLLQMEEKVLIIDYNYGVHVLAPTTQFWVLALIQRTYP